MLLAVDTATQRASIALHDGRALRAECTWEASQRHTVTLAAHLTTLLDECGVTLPALRAVAVCVGPGSYTGVRIGVALAQGLALARGLPLIGISTLDILAAAQPPDTRPLYAVFAAGRKRVGYARYGYYQEHGWQAETEIALVDGDALGAQLVTPALLVGELESCGATWPAGIELPPPVWHLRRAGFLAELAWQQLRAGVETSPAEIKPVYAA